MLIVDAANVVGSVPDGWWRDRAGAATRLRDAVSGLAVRGLPEPEPTLAPPLEVLLVVEGAARGVEGTESVRVVSAAHSGDDAIVELVRELAGTRVVAVVTADRALRDRVTALGAQVLGPRRLPYPAANRR